MVDAAALGGAQDLAQGVPDAHAATTAASTYFNNNGSAQSGIFGATSPTITFSTTLRANDTITVSATRRVDFNFLKVIGIDHGTSTKSATVVTHPLTVTGYDLAAVAPFTIWGGSRQSEVHPGDASCPLHVCVGRTYTFLDTSWMSANGTPTAPDWTALGNGHGNGFKGDINHGNPGTTVQVGDTFSATTHPGFGSVTAPTVGRIIVLPIIDSASGNGTLSLHIAAWVFVKVNSGCAKQHCDGDIQSLTTTPPAGWSTAGSNLPPTTLRYSLYSSALTN